MKTEKTLLSWGSDYNTSYQALQGQWYICNIGRLQEVARASEILVCEVCESDQDKIRCPSDTEIIQTMNRLSHIGGIPTLPTNPVLDSRERFNGGPVTPASLVGALKITLASEEYGHHSATILITCTKMVRVYIETELNVSDDLSAMQKARLAAGVMKAFGNISFAHCLSVKRDEYSVVNLRGRTVLKIYPADKDLFLRFALWDDHNYPTGLWVGCGGPEMNEGYEV